jgi:hypothetical protein
MIGTFLNVTLPTATLSNMEKRIGALPVPTPMADELPVCCSPSS